MGIVKRILQYSGKRKFFLPLSAVLSAVSAIFALLPYVMIWVIIRTLLDLGTEEVDTVAIQSYSYYAFVAAGLSVLLYFVSLLFSHLTAFKVERNLKYRAMSNMLHVPLGFFDDKKSGSLRKVIDEDASNTHSFIAHQLADFGMAAVTPITLIVFLFFFDFRMGLLCLIPIFLAFISIGGGSMKKEAQEFRAKYFSCLQELSGQAVEYVRGIPVVKVFQQSVFSFKSFFQSLNRYTDFVMTYTLLYRRPMAIYTVALQAFAFILVPTAILFINNDAPLGKTITDFIFYILVTPLFTVNIMKVMYYSDYKSLAEESLNRIEALINAEHIQYGEQTKLNNHMIEFKNVTFSYPSSKAPVIQNLSFCLEEGKTYALVGPSGGGKTTIAQLIARFRDPQEGQVSIGGIDIKALSKECLMDSITFIFQNTKLLKDSLRNNILFAKENASEQEIEKALELSQSTEIIKNLPAGLDTEFGAKGTYLSGGEQQRISLTRAFLKNSPIVLLDEATAFTDPENEYEIKKALKSLLKNKTGLMIAHKLDSVVDVDCILVIKDGKIEESGSHQELLTKNGLYKSMWEEYKQAANWKA